MITGNRFFIYTAVIGIIIIMARYLSLQSYMIYGYQTSEELTIDLADTTVKIGSETTSWVILSFTDISYLPVARMWYDRLSTLGYVNHVIMALDVSSHVDLIKGNYRCERVADTIQGKISNIWKLRFEVPLRYLKRGINVFVTDIDTFWNFYCY